MLAELVIVLAVLWALSYGFRRRTGHQHRRLEALEEEVRRLQDVDYRLEELEERLDFAERALAQMRRREPLGPGG